jgi:hypothetical protein
VMQIAHGAPGAVAQGDAPVLALPR